MTLNLPAFDIKIIVDYDGNRKVYDCIRQKYVALTPEEIVRQHFVNFLLVHRGYPSLYVANEVGLLQNGCRRRCDTVIYDHYAKPLAIVEYKAPQVVINARVFDQIVRYNMELRVGWLMVSNGLKHYCCRIEGDSYRFVKEIPSYEELIIDN